MREWLGHCGNAQAQLHEKSRQFIAGKNMAGALICEIQSNLCRENGWCTVGVPRQKLKRNSGNLFLENIAGALCGAQTQLNVETRQDISGKHGWCTVGVPRPKVM